MSNHKQLVAHGAAYGPGIYTSPNISVAYGYTVQT